MTLYPLTLAIKSIIREKWINLLSIMTIAAGLLIIGLAFFAVYNVRAATGRLPEKFAIMLYLKDGLKKEKIDAARDLLVKDRSVESVRYISREEGMKELKSLLKSSSYVLDGLAENPLPDVFEVRLKRDSVSPEAVRRLADSAAKIDGVHEVDYGEKFLSSFNYLKIGLNSVGIALIVILSSGIVFVCYSTVKILFYRKNEEIETFKLLGATRAFIRIPFVIEGALIGGLGGALSLMGMFAFYFLVLLRLSLAIPVFKSVLFPMDFFLFLPLIGMLLGITGAFIALGRLKY